MVQVLINDCHGMKDEKQVRGSCSSYFNWNYLGPSQVPQLREQNWLISHRLSDGEKENQLLYTQIVRWYAFTTGHVRYVIYRERGLLITGEKDIFKKKLIFLKVIWLFLQIFDLPCWATDLAALQRALRPVRPINILMICHDPLLPESPW